jgi:hypothetical protein
MKRLSKSLTILLIVLTVSVISCTTTPTVTKLEIPPFPLAMPERPVLDLVPNETLEAIKILTDNLNKLINYVEKIELYSEIKDRYVENVFQLITDY